MVSYSAIQSSNSLIASELPSGLVGVFAGGTSGVGEYTLKAFAKHVKQPRVYFYGRSAEAGARIKAECEAINPEGTYVFKAVDLSLMRNVDEVCKEIKEREKVVNLLCLSQAVAYNTDVTDEGVRVPIALWFHSRFRFIVNLLPLLQKATGLRRVVQVFAGGVEGPIDVNDFQLKQAGYSKPLVLRGHFVSMITLGMEYVASNQAGDIGFVHTFPGPVKSGIFREGHWAVRILWIISKLLGPFSQSEEESGERHLFLGTSAMYPGKKPDGVEGVVLQDGLSVAKGADGEVGSGVYTPGGPSTEVVQGPAVKEVLEKMRREGVLEKIWVHMEEEFQRIVGSVSI